MIIVNYLLPCLTFNKVLSSIDASDLKTIGVMLLTAVLYQVMGLSFSVLTWATTPNPTYWLGGLLLAGTFTNTSDLPIAYITTLSSGSLFTADEVNKGIAYCVIFLTVFIFSMFNLGAFRLVERDFSKKTDDIESGAYNPDSVHSPGLRHLLRDLKYWYASRTSRQNVGVTAHANTTSDSAHQQQQQHQHPREKPEHGLERSHSHGSNVTSRSHRGVARNTVPGLGTLERDDDMEQEAYQSENMTDVINAYSHPTRVHSRNSQVTVATGAESLKLEKEHTTASGVSQIIQRKHKAFHEFLARYNLNMVWEFFKNFLRPPSAALIISIVFTMIPQVRRLFYVSPDTKSYGIPNAPDGAPVLGSIMDFTSFVGNATVPLGLSMLGATMASLSIGKLPQGFWKNVILMAVLKLVVLPIVSIAWTSKMKSLGWIESDNLMALFVMIVASGVPTATSQVYLTAIYTPAHADRKEMDCLAAYLIAQYCLLIFSMTILLTYTLKNVLNL